MSSIRLVCGLLGTLLSLLAALAYADQEGLIDFTDRMTPVCELHELVAVPPQGWISVPIDTGEAQLTGCQMMLSQDGELIGVIRLLSFDWSTAPQDLSPWPQHIMTMESVWIEEMGYSITKPLWRRNSVPISGPGFGNGQAIGFAVTISGSESAHESHMLVFDRGQFKYLIDLLTPAQTEQEGLRYQANSKAMGEIMQSLKLVASEY